MTNHRNPFNITRISAKPTNNLRITLIYTEICYSKCFVVAARLPCAKYPKLMYISFTRHMSTENGAKHHYVTCVGDPRAHFQLQFCHQNKTTAITHHLCHMVNQVTIVVMSSKWPSAVAIESITNMENK